VSTPESHISTDIYQSLALIYDDVMSDIDYELWSNFIDAIIQNHNPDTYSILELACGTGSFAISLDELDCYNITATDLSQEMIDVARKKADYINATVDFKQMDFTRITIDQTYDVVLMLFDSINYLLSEKDIITVLQQIKPLLNRNGYFIFDFTTPSNSEKAEKLLNDKGLSHNNYQYIRKSKYDAIEGIHYNEFQIEKLDSNKNVAGEIYHEIHKQRVYTLAQMTSIVNQSDFKLVAKYDTFDLIEADDNSDRITMVLQ